MAAARKKSSRFQPSVIALREIRRYQKSTDLVIRRAGFSRVLREVVDSIVKSDGSFIYKFDSHAVAALHESCEEYATSLFRDAVVSRDHDQRLCLFPEDMKLARRIRGESF
jgi:histone H3/H4